MNDDANKPELNTSAPPSVVTQRANLQQDSGNAGVQASSRVAAPMTPSGGSPLKVAIPIALLVAVVFGVTFISQYGPKSVDDDTSNDAPNQANVAKSKTTLSFGSSIRMFNPNANTGSLQDQTFTGFYEVGEKWNSASFWFENRNPSSVTMQLTRIGAGCAKCSRGRLAAIPPDVTDQLVLTAVISGFPQGLTSVLPLAVVGSASNLAPERLNWQDYLFRDNPNPEYKVPPAPDSGHVFSYLWGIFDLQFQIKSARKTDAVEAEFALQVDGTKTKSNANLAVQFQVVDPFDVSTDFINVGEWKDENSEPRTFNFFVYSSTRGPHRTGESIREDLIAPTVDVRMPGSLGEPGPFVTVSPAVRIPDPDLWRIRGELENALKKFMRVESAYHYTVTVRPKVGDDRADIGLLERDIFVAIPDMKEPKKIRIKGTVRGSVWLDNDRTNIDLPSYRYSQGTSQTIRLICEKRDADVALIADECSPSFAKYELKKLPPAPDRGYYELTVTIPKESRTGSWNGVISLELKGTRPQRIRIPIRGAPFY